MQRDLGDPPQANPNGGNAPPDGRGTPFLPGMLPGWNVFQPAGNIYGAHPFYGFGAMPANAAFPPYHNAAFPGNPNAAFPAYHNAAFNHNAAPPALPPALFNLAARANANRAPPVNAYRAPLVNPNRGQYVGGIPLDWHGQGNMPFNWNWNREYPFANQNVPHIDGQVAQNNPLHPPVPPRYFPYEQPTRTMRRQPQQAVFPAGLRLLGQAPDIGGHPVQHYPVDPHNPPQYFPYRRPNPEMRRPPQERARGAPLPQAPAQGRVAEMVQAQEAPVRIKEELVETEHEQRHPINAGRPIEVEPGQQQGAEGVAPEPEAGERAMARERRANNSGDYIVLLAPTPVPVPEPIAEAAGEEENKVPVEAGEAEEEAMDLERGAQDLGDDIARLSAASMPVLEPIAQAVGKEEDFEEASDAGEAEEEALDLEGGAQDSDSDISRLTPASMPVLEHIVQAVGGERNEVEESSEAGEAEEEAMDLEGGAHNPGEDFVRLAPAPVPVLEEEAADLETEAQEPGLAAIELAQDPEPVAQAVEAEVNQNFFALVGGTVGQPNMADIRAANAAFLNEATEDEMEALLGLLDLHNAR